MPPLRLCAWRIALAVCAAGSAVAQVDYATSTLQGSVLDPQDKIVVGATVVATNEVTGATRSAVPNEQGYSFLALRPATYRVEVDAAGFSKSVARDVLLTVGQSTTWDVH